MNWGRIITLVGGAVLLVTAVVFVSGEGWSDNLQNVTTDQARAKVQQHGNLWSVRLPRGATLSGFTRDATNLFGVWIMNCQTEGSLVIKNGRTERMWILQTTVAGDLVIGEEIGVRDICLVDVAIGGTLELPSLTNDDRLELQFRTPPKAIRVPDAETAERVHIAAPSIPIIF